jgi:hypothetical protein
VCWVALSWVFVAWPKVQTRVSGLKFQVSRSKSTQNDDIRQLGQPTLKVTWWGRLLKALTRKISRNRALLLIMCTKKMGDIAAMGSDLFGSFTKVTCAFFVISITSVELVMSNAFLFPTHDFYW